VVTLIRNTINRLRRDLFVQINGAQRFRDDFYLPEQMHLPEGRSSSIVGHGVNDQNGLRDVEIAPKPISRLLHFVGFDRLADVRDSLRAARASLGGRPVWHVSQSSTRGGVAELLHANLPYQLAEGINCRWTVLDTNDEFRDFVKELYYCLCGVLPSMAEGDLEHGRALYEAECRRNAALIMETAHPETIFAIHDHQAAGLLPILRDAGYTMIWRIHVSAQTGNDAARHAWDFLRPYVANAHASVASTADAMPPDLVAGRRYVLSPSIDPLAVKNMPLDANVPPAHIAARAGVLESPSSGGADHEQLVDLLIRNPAVVVRSKGPIPLNVPLVTQVSRWDKVKDIPGVIRAFVEYTDPTSGAHLALVGPDTSRDSRGDEVFRQCLKLWSGLVPARRERVHLIQLPVANQSEHALTVNAIQRQSTVIAQKSFAEGFGLTVTEAAWKGRPVVASPVGGIRDQVQHGKTGLLLSQPNDLEGLGAAIDGLLADANYAESLGRNAHDHVRSNFLVDSELYGTARVLSTVSSDSELISQPDT
jgi:trehalose synthase